MVHPPAVPREFVAAILAAIENLLLLRVAAIGKRGAFGRWVNQT
jgi:hypothetical protein